MDQLTNVLRHSRLFAGLNDAELARTLELAESVHLLPGEVACRKGEPASRVCIVESGRLRAGAGGADNRAVAWLEPGDSFGEVAAMESTEYTFTMTAAEDSRVLAIPAEAFRILFDEIPVIGRNMIRSLGGRLKRAYGLEGQAGGPRVVGVVHDGARSAALLRRLCAELESLGEHVAIIDAGDGHPNGNGRGGHIMSDEPEEQIARLSAAHDRVFAEFAVEHMGAGAAPLALCDEVLWFAEPGEDARLFDAMAAAAAEMAAVAARSRLLWVLPPDMQVAPNWLPKGYAGGRPMMVELTDEAEPSRRELQGLHRLARHIRGVTLGLALAGGGARGMAHLGVFRALERAGIDFDVMSGTSAGALVGAVYAAGHSPDYLVDAFTRELSAPAWMRHMPAGVNWHLMGKFRSGAWDPTLRRYLFDWRLEQFPIPFNAVTVDLITGAEVVRNSGDAVSAVLSSINVPVISRPICSEGRVFVDGAVLNNLPADVLTRAGADFVAGVDVSSRLRTEFAGNTPDTPTPQMRLPGFIETLFRVLETQAHGLTSLRTRTVDVMIEPDTSAFNFADFSRAAELADAGEAAAETAIPALREALAKFERKAAVSVA